MNAMKAMNAMKCLTPQDVKKDYINYLEVRKMPFKDGKYKHSSGFTIIVMNGEIMLSPDHPVSVRLSDLFNSSKWEEVK